MTKATLEVVDDIHRNCHAVSKFGFRHDSVLKTLSVLVYNKSQSALRLLNDNLPEIFLSPARCLQVRNIHKGEMSCLPGLNMSQRVAEHFKQYGWEIDGSLGPLQFSQDSTRIRELVKPYTKLKVMVGFRALKDKEGEWSFYQTYETYEDIKKAFIVRDKAG